MAVTNRLVEREKRLYVNIRQGEGITRCVNPYLLVLGEPLTNVISMSLNVANIHGTFNPDNRSVCIYMPECQGCYDWYDSRQGYASITPFAFVPVVDYRNARWINQPFVKIFEYPIPFLNQLTIYMLNLDRVLDTRVMNVELWFTIRYLSPASAY